MSVDIPEKLPTVEEFKTIVGRQLTFWSVSTVDGLCFSQTETLINDLAPYYHSGEKDAVPEVTSFKEVFSTFQQKHERVTFVDLADPEVQELITLLAPYFQTMEDQPAISENDSTNNADLDQIQF